MTFAGSHTGLQGTWSKHQEKKMIQMGALETASSLNSGQATVPCLRVIVASPFPPRATAQGCRAMNNHKPIISPHPEKAGCGECCQRRVGQECSSSACSQTRAGCRTLCHTRYIFRTKCVIYDLHQTLRAAWWPKRGGLHISLPPSPPSACPHLPSRLPGCQRWVTRLTALRAPRPPAPAAGEESMDAF